MSDIAFSSKEATKGGFQAIKKFEGNLIEHKKIANKFAKPEDTKPAPEQIEVYFEDVVILEMADGEPEVELKDNKFSLLFNYALPGRKPHKNSKWIAGYVKSAEEAFKKSPKELEGERLIMEQRDTFLFKSKDKDTGVEEDIIVPCFVFTSGDGGVDPEERVKGIILGKNKAAAYRAVMLDNYTKRLPEITSKVQNGEPVAGLEMKDGTYQAVG